MKTRFLFLLISCLACTQLSFGQQLEYTGTIKDAEGIPLPGVNIEMQGNENAGTQSDFDGKFTLHAKEGDILIFNFLGFETLKETLGPSKNLDITMTKGAESLDEVMITVGYGRQKEKHLTGSVSKVESQDLRSRPLHSFEDALSGLAPGVTVAHRSNAIGESGNTYIRGIGSISAGTDPLYVVDGFPTDVEIANSINPNAIESIDILKDASSTSIYGSRGANGVIQITTKAGIERDLQVNVSLKTGITTPDKNGFYDVLNAEEYLEWYKEKAINNGTEIPDFITNWDGVTNTNWQNEIYTTKPFQNYSISAFGGTKKVSYLFSGGVIDQNGVLRNTGFQRYTFNTKLDFKPTDGLSFGINLAPSYSVQRNSAPDDDYSSLPGAAIHLPPIIPVYDNEGNPSDPNIYGVLNKEMANPLAIAESFQNKIKKSYVLMNLYGEINLLKDLRFRSTFGVNVLQRQDKLYQYPLRGQALSAETNLSLDSYKSLKWVNENTLTYDKQLNDDHNINLLLGYSIEKNNIETLHGDANTFSSDLPRTIGFGSVQNVNSGLGSNSLMSYFGRLNYNFRDKYLVTATLRRDGSSRFGSNNKWGTFPSVGVGWNIKEEKFLNEVNFINFAKIRASYGKTGSNSIGDFSAVSSLVSRDHSFNGNDVVGFINGDPGNPGLSWEISKQFDIGFDASLFNNRFKITFDYYNDLTTDLLLAVNVPPSTGFSSNLSNIGKMRKWGYEGALHIDLIRNQDWGWNVGVNFAYMDHKILKLGPSGDTVRWFFDVLETPVGGRLEQVHVLKQTGILTQQDLDNGVAHKPGDQPGDIKFYDANGDGTIDAFNGEDGILMGNNIPNILYGINSSVSYKNLRLSTVLNGQGGAHLLDFVYQSMSSHGNNTNMSNRFYNGRWQSADQPGDGKTPRAGYNDEGAVSSWEVQSTNFLRIQNISLNYNFPQKIIDHLPVNNLNAYLSVENVYTFTKFEGGNPQATRLGSERIVGNNRTISLNSVASPPLPRIFTIGIDVAF